MPASLIAILAVALLLAVTGGPVSAADDSLLLSSEQAFFSAVAKSDREGAGKLLDADFTWTDAAGRTLSRSQLLKTLLPKPALMAGEGLADKRYNYGDVAVFETDRGKMHTLRIWVKRPAGWRAMVYQEVRSLETPLSFTPGVAKDCENPCKRIPYSPKNAAETRVLSAYEALESAGVAKDATAWGAITADEFAGATSNSDRVLDKNTRMSEMARSNMAGLSPTMVLSAEMFDVPGAVVMKSEQQPDHGKPLHVTRLWIVRGGQWLITLSYQTSIEAGQAAP